MSSADWLEPRRRAGCAATATAAAATTAEQLHSLSDDSQFGVFLAVLFPGVEFQSPLDQHRRTFAEVFAGDLRLTGPEGHVDEGRFFDPVAIGSLAAVVDRQPDFGHRRAGRDVAQFRVAGDIAHENNTIEAGHNGVLPQCDASGRQPVRLFPERTQRRSATRFGRASH